MGARHTCPAFCAVALAGAILASSGCTDDIGGFLGSYAAIISINKDNVVFVSEVREIVWVGIPDNSVTLMLSMDGGMGWMVIQSGYPTSSGSYWWSVPGMSSSDCILKVIGDYSGTEARSATFAMNIYD